MVAGVAHESGFDHRSTQASCMVASQAAGFDIHSVRSSYMRVMAWPKVGLLTATSSDQSQHKILVAATAGACPR